MDYIDFVLRISPGSDPGHFAVSAKSPTTGESSGVFIPPLSDTELENFILKIGLTRRGVRRIQSPEWRVAQGFGQKLYVNLFADDIRASFLASRNDALREGKGVRVKVIVDAPALVNYPWEYLYDSSMGRFLSLYGGTPIVRYVELAAPPQPLRVAPPLRVLVLASSPSDYPALDLAHEKENLDAALADLVKQNQISIDWLEDASLEALRSQLLKGPYHIFHYIGHGGFDESTQDGLLILEDEFGRGKAVSGERLAVLLGNHPSLRLAILNSCEGARTSAQDPFAGAAMTLVRGGGLGAVVAMQFEITDEASIAFSRGFYSGLAAGDPVDAAVAQARLAIFAQDNDVEWGTPVLYLRAPDGLLFAPLLPEQVAALDRMRAEKEKREQEQQEVERRAQEKAEAERIAREKAEQERLAQERAEAERAAQARAEQERLAREQAKVEQEALARERAEQAKLIQDRINADRVAREQADKERAAREQAEKQRIAREKAATAAANPLPHPISPTAATPQPGIATPRVTRSAALPTPTYKAEPAMPVRSRSGVDRLVRVIGILAVLGLLAAGSWYAYDALRPPRVVVVPGATRTLLPNSTSTPNNFDGTATARFLGLAVLTPTITAPAAGIPSSTRLPTTSATLSATNTSAPTRIPPTATARAAAPAATTRAPLATGVPTPSGPPTISIVRVRTDPADTRRNQQITFYVTFRNTYQDMQQRNWSVWIYLEDQPRKPFWRMEPAKSSPLPPGTDTEIASTPTWCPCGPGGPQNYTAYVRYISDDGADSPVPDLNGNPYALGFTVNP